MKHDLEEEAKHDIYIEHPSLTLLLHLSTGRWWQERFVSLRLSLLHEAASSRVFPLGKESALFTDLHGINQCYPSISSNYTRRYEIPSLLSFHIGVISPALPTLVYSSFRPRACHPFKTTAKKDVSAISLG